MKKIFFLSLLTSIVITQTSAFKSNYHRDEERRKKITQTLLDNMIKENYEDVRKDFSVSLKQALPVEKISETWKQWISTYGSFEKVLSVSAASDKGYNQIRIRCKFKNENSTIETTFTEEDKVIALFIKP